MFLIQRRTKQCNAQDGLETGQQVFMDFMSKKGDIPVLACHRTDLFHLGEWRLHASDTCTTRKS